MTKKKLKYSFFTIGTLSASFMFSIYHSAAFTEMPNQITQNIYDIIEQNTKSDSNPNYATVERFRILDDKQKQFDSGHLLYAYAGALKDVLRKQIDESKLQYKMKIDSLSDNFFYQYSSYITGTETLWDSINPKCLSQKQLIDDVARATDFPAVLVTATWQIETSCNLWSSTFGPFQIMRRNYRTDDFSILFFLHQVKDFIDFSQNKRANYNRVNADDGFTVALWYGYWTLQDLVRHGALYNWLSWWTMYGDAQPANPYYVYGNFNDDYAYRKDWLLTDIWKTLKADR